MKEQTELIEYMQEKRVKDRLASVNEYCGCKFFFLPKYNLKNR
jgi:hypothetical protein